MEVVREVYRSKLDYALRNTEMMIHEGWTGWKRRIGRLFIYPIFLPMGLIESIDPFSLTKNPDGTYTRLILRETHYTE